MGNYYKRYGIHLIFISIFFLSSCAALRPSPEQIQNADYGPYPDNYEQIIKD